jgi:hypothetical protein
VLTLGQKARKLISVAYKVTEEMAVGVEKLICRLWAEVKEFCVDIFGDDGVKTDYRKNQIVFTNNCNYY